MARNAGADAEGVEFKRIYESCALELNSLSGICFEGK
jgi:hypothetical protein